LGLGFRVGVPRSWVLGLRLGLGFGVRLGLGVRRLGLGVRVRGV
jgi:hypothetical protein